MSKVSTVPIVLVVLLAGLTAGCGDERARWGIDEPDLGTPVEEITDHDTRLVDQVQYSDWTCRADYYARLAWNGSFMEESEWAEYLVGDSRILVSIAPYNSRHETDEGRELGPPGQALVTTRSQLSECDPSAPNSTFHSAGTRASFEVEGDVSPEAVDADMFTLDASEPFGWAQHYVGPFSIDEQWSDAGLEVLAFDGMDERYAQGYYAIVEDAFVAVHVVSSVEPEISAEEVMDVMREKLAADPPASRFAGGDVSGS